MKGKGGAGAVAMGKALISNFTPGNQSIKVRIGMKMTIKTLFDIILLMSGKTPGFSGRGGESLADIFSSKV